MPSIHESTMMDPDFDDGFFIATVMHAAIDSGTDGKQKSIQAE